MFRGCPFNISMCVYEGRHVFFQPEPESLFHVTVKHIGTDHLTCRGGGGMVLCFVQNFFYRTTRELEFFFPEFNIRLYDKNSESDYFFFPPPKSEYFFQQYWESEYFFRKKNINPPSPFQVKWSFPYYMLYWHSK